MGAYPSMLPAHRVDSLPPPPPPLSSSSSSGSANHPDKGEARQTHPRPQGIERDACVEVERRQRRRQAFVSPSPPSRGSWHGALSRGAVASPSIPCEPPSPLAAACITRAATRPSESPGADNGSGRFCAGISSPAAPPESRSSRRLWRRSHSRRWGEGRGRWRWFRGEGGGEREEG
nr:unnamed protein product [Digitaria exilis]